MSNNVTLYHVTPRINQASIIQHGLEPERATGRRLVVWLCAEHRLAWALAHISARKHVAVDDLVIATCKGLDLDDLGRTAWEGVFTSGQMIRPVAYAGAYMGLRLEESKMLTHSSEQTHF